MGLLQRLFKVGQAEAHAVVDKLQDPIKLTEQGIRDLKNDLDKSLQALAEVKALCIRTKREFAESQDKAQNYEQKAMLLLKRVEDGSLDSSEADRLAREALLKKEEFANNALRLKSEVERVEGNIGQLDVNVQKLRSTISHYENELKTLKARARVSSASKKINKSLAGIDSGSTVSMLEKMKEKVAQEEALSEAYGEVANSNKNIDDEINNALESSNLSADNALEELKRKINSNNNK